MNEHSDDAILRNCPSEADWNAFLGDEVNAVESDRLETHLEDCDACQLLVCRLSGDEEQLESWQRMLRGDDGIHLTSRLVGGSSETGVSQAATAPEVALERPRLSADRPAPDIAEYRILGELGRGGMAVVYKAEHVTLGRIVALKMILAGAYAGPERLARFRDEAEAVAKLNHPHIVQIYAVGEHEGLPYLSLEFVDGPNLKQVIDGAAQRAGFAAGMVESLAAAIHVAHQQGIVHRDLKPENVLLQRLEPEAAVPREGGARQAAYIPKITDFGLAKQLESAVATQSGNLIGTPQYMAPEQVDPAWGAISAATDVYTLGCILYELLTGRPPFAAATSAETIRQIVSCAPIPLRQLDRSISRDLETICLKCLEKEPPRRYASAAVLGADLQRFLAGQPIQARPTPAWERVVKWARRAPVTAALVLISAVAVLALTGIITGSFFYTRLHQALRAAERAQQRAEAARQAEAENRQRAEQFQYFHRIALADAAWRDGNLQRTVQLLAACPPEQRQWEWHYLNGLCKADLQLLRGHNDWVTSVAVGPRGARLASSGEDGFVKVWDVASGEPLLALSVPDRNFEGVSFSPDGQRLGACAQGLLVVWELPTGRELLTISNSDHAMPALAFSPDGARVAGGYGEGPVGVWDAKTGLLLHQLKGHEAIISSLAYSPRGNRLASASFDTTIRVWDTDTASELLKLEGHDGWVLDVAYSPDATRLASASMDRTVRFWDGETGQETLVLRGHTSSVQCIAFSPDGKQLASAGADQTIRLWKATTGSLVRVLKGHTNAISSLVFSPDGARLFSAGRDGTVRFWSMETDQPARALRGHRGKIWSVAFNSQGTRLASAGEDRTVRVWDLATGQTMLTLSGHTQMVPGVAFSPDGERLASASVDRTVKIWEAATGREQLTLLGHTDMVWCVAFSPDGARLASASFDRTVKVWDAATGDERLTFEGHGSPVVCVAFSPDGRLLASSERDGIVKVWEASNGREVQTFRGHAQGVESVMFSSHGSRVVSASYDQTVKVWDVSSGECLRTLAGHSWHITAAAINPDGTRLATASGDGSVKIWDLPSGEEILTLRDHTHRVQSVAFSPDGRQLVSAGFDRTIKIWDARPWTPEVALEREAVGLLNFLFALPLCQEDVIEHVGSAPDLGPAVREKAILLAGHYSEETDAECFYQAAWAVVRQSYLGAVQYGLALRQAETARRLAPDEPRYQTTVGVAQYRAERYAEALSTLSRVDQLESGDSTARAFLAMTQARLGQHDEARDTLARLRRTLQAESDDKSDLLPIAEALVDDLTASK